MWLSPPVPGWADESFDPYWVQNHRPTDLWSGPDEQSISFGVVPQWNYFKVVEPQQGPRLYVLDPRTANYAWVTALDLGPSDAPPAPESESPVTGTTNNAFQPWWVSNHSATPLWSGPEQEAINLGLAPAWNFFQVLEPQDGARLRVRDPRTQGEAYVEAIAVGPASAPDGLDLPTGWWGYIGIPIVNIRAAATTESEKIGQLVQDTPVVVRKWVEGEAVAADDPTWAELADGTYVWAPLLRRVTMDAPAPPPRMLRAEKWIDVNLTLQLVTAYEKDRAVHLANTSSGRPGWETPTGVFYIQRRVEKEVMDSNTLLGKDTERADYRVEDVRWTQYFTHEGHALHENYWKHPDTFGVPSSHGCLGLLAKDAEWFWNWASVGTPVYIHY